MIYTLDLRWTGLVIGVALILLHLPALVKGKAFEKWLRDFPRSRAIGTMLMAVAGLWSLWLVATMDLGEFAGMRRVMVIAVIALAYLAWAYMPEFLAVRALGMIFLLLAEPALEAAFLQPQLSRLLLVALAYGWIVLGLFWVSIPWLMRDQITWLTGQSGRLKIAAAAGAVYGAILAGTALLCWK